ncbi:MAG: TRAP transporter small permease [Gammaproteobacteria bacterium]|nr:TRAP transporter small permease [Gammaproteobacteria bacterium]
MFLAIFLLFLLQIVARYLLRWPIGWPDEAITFLFVWVCFWGGALMVPLQRHISFDILDELLSATWRRRTRLATMIATCALFVAALPVTADFILFSHRQLTPVIELPLSAVYAPVFLFLLVMAIRLAVAIRQEWRTSPERAP